MSKKEIFLEHVYQTAFEYEKKYGGCSQAVLGAIKEITSNISDQEYRAATGLAGGIGLEGHSCGGVTGGVMAIGSFIGRDFSNKEDKQGIRKETYRLARDLISKFEEFYGSGLCKNIQTKIMGKSFKLYREDDFAEFESLGGHDDKCTSVCGNAAKWTMEILINEGLYKI